MNDRLAHRPRRSPRPSRSGQAMVEFAIISFVLTAMLAGFLGIIVMGLGSFQNNIATESAGRVLDQHDVFIKENFAMHFDDSDSDDYFDPNSDIFQDITARQVYRFLNEYDINPNEVKYKDVLYDESRLIISPKDWDNRTNLDPPLPAINQSLLGQYIFDPDLDAYRFPGAVVTNERTGEQTVVIPLLPKPRDILIGPPPPPSPPPPRGIDRSFYVKSSDPSLFYPVSDDWVAPVVIGKVQDGDSFEFRIIMFHPSQPASTINLELERNVQGRITKQTPVVADDQAVDDAIGDLPNDYELTPPVINEEIGASSSRGKYGLGETFAFIKTVRPYRAVFETASLFRMGASPITVKYEADGMPITLVDKSIDTHTMDTPTSPFIAYEDNDDQSLKFETSVLFNIILPRYFIDFPLDPPASADNDFAKNVLRLLPNDDGVWRVSVAAEFEAVGGSWGVNHVLQLWLYRNGVRERLIATHNVTSSHAEPISISGQAIIQAQNGDVLQVRVFTDDGGAGTYDVRLTGVPSSNWVAFERVDD